MPAQRPPLALPEGNFPDGFVGLRFNTSVGAIGGWGRYSVLLSGNVPAGLELVQGPTSITMGGMPTVPGTYDFRVVVTDELGSTVQHDYSVTIHPELVHPQDQQVTISDAEVFRFSDADNVFFPARILDMESFHFADAVDVFMPLKINVAESFHFNDSDDVFKPLKIAVSESFRFADADSTFMPSMINDPEIFHFEDTATVNVTLGVSPATTPQGAYGVPYIQAFSVAGNTGSATLIPNGSLPSGMCFSTTTTCPTGRINYGSSIRLEGTPTEAGTFNFTLTAQDSVNTAVVTYTLVIIPVSQTIMIGAVPSPVYGGPTFTLSATASSGLPVTIASTSSLASGSNPFTPAGAGTAAFRATQPGDGSHYGVAPPVTFNVTISPAALKLTAFNASRRFDHPNPNFFSIFSGFVNGDTAGVVSGTTTNSTVATILSPVSGSPYAITPSTSNLSAANYTIQPLNGELTITPNSQIITFYKVPDLHLGSNFPLTAVASSGLPVTYSVTGPAVVSNNTLGVVGLGTVTVTANQAGNTNYSAATAVVRSFTAQ